MRRGTIDPDAASSGTKLGVMITPEQLAKAGTEHAHQTAIMQWCAMHRSEFEDLDMLFAVPNGGDRRPSVAAAMKAEGVKSGVPDLCLPVPRGHFAGLYLELKVPKYATLKNGNRSDKQIEWHKKLRRQHYAVVTAFGWQPTVRAIQDYYAQTFVMPHDTDDCAFYKQIEVVA